MKKIYKKLVRDNIPAIIEQSGKKANYRVLDKEEFKIALKAKLVEEVNEFLESETKEQQQEEFGDIMLVLYTIENHFNFNDEALNIGIQKANWKGLFEKKYFLESVED